MKQYVKLITIVKKGCVQLFGARVGIYHPYIHCERIASLAMILDKPFQAVQQLHFSMREVGEWTARMLVREDDRILSPTDVRFGFHYQDIN